MEEIDKQFRPKLDFMIAWACLTVPGVWLALKWIKDPWYSVAAFAIVIPFFTTFAVYGPVLLVLQICRSGARGRFVGRVFGIVLAFAIFTAAILFLTGNVDNMFWSMALPFVAIVYLNWRLRKGQSARRD